MIQIVLLKNTMIEIKKKKNNKEIYLCINHCIYDVRMFNRIDLLFNYVDKFLVLK